MKVSKFPVILIELEDDNDENDDLNSSVSFEEYYTKTNQHLDSLLETLHAPRRRKSRRPIGEVTYSRKNTPLPVYRPIAITESPYADHRPMRTQRQSDVMSSESLGPYALIVAGVGVAVYLAFNLFSLAMGRSAKYRFKDIFKGFSREYDSTVLNTADVNLRLSEELYNPATRWWEEESSAVKRGKANLPKGKSNWVKEWKAKDRKLAKP